jgi:hypothetical protein
VHTHIASYHYYGSKKESSCSQAGKAPHSEKDDEDGCSQAGKAPHSEKDDEAGKTNDQARTALVTFCPTFTKTPLAGFL